MNDNLRYKKLWFALGYGMSWQRWAMNEHQEKFNGWLPIQ